MNTKILKEINRKLCLYFDYMPDLKDRNFVSISYNFNENETTITLVNSNVFYLVFEKDQLSSIKKITKTITEEKTVEVNSEFIHIPGWA